MKNLENYDYIVILKDYAKEIGREDHFHPTEVGVFFGEPGKTVPDPYFNGEGPVKTNNK